MQGMSDMGLSVWVKMGFWRYVFGVVFLAFDF